MPDPDLRIPRSRSTDSGEPTTWQPAVLNKVEAHLAEALYKPADLDRCLAALTRGQMALYAVAGYEIEINSGGHLHYFSSSDGALAHEAREGLVLFGADQFEEALTKALSGFPGSAVPRDRDEREQLLEAIDPELLEEADTLFFNAYTGEESLAKLARLYVEAHPEEFFA